MSTEIRVTVDWDDDGNFANANSNVTSDISGEVYWRHGRRGNKGSTAPAPPSFCVFTLDNRDGLYSPLSRNTALREKIVKRRRVRIDAREFNTNQWFRQFTGLITEINVGSLIDDQTVTFVCHGLKWLFETGTRALSYFDESVMDILDDMCEQVGITSDERDFADEITPVSISAISYEQSLELIETITSGFIFDTHDGKLKYQLNSARIDGPFTGVITDTPTTAQQGYDVILHSDVEDGVYNYFESTARDFYVKRFTGYNQGIGPDDSILESIPGFVRLPAQETTKFRLSKTSTAFAISSQVLIDYIEVHDNIGGIGLNFANDINSWEIDSMEINTNEVIITATNKTVFDLYITELFAKGAGLVIANSREVVSSDEDSIAKFGLRPYPFKPVFTAVQDDPGFGGFGVRGNTAAPQDLVAIRKLFEIGQIGVGVGDPVSIIEIAPWVERARERFANPAPYFVITSHPYQAGDINLSLSRRVSDKVGLVATNDAGIGYDGFAFIEGIENTVDDNNNLTQRLWLGTRDTEQITGDPTTRTPGVPNPPNVRILSTTQTTATFGVSVVLSDQVTSVEYRVYERGGSPPANWNTIIAPYRIELMGLKINTAYTLEVRSINIVGTSNPTELGFTTLRIAVVPDAPVIVGSSASENLASVTWETRDLHGSAIAAQYRVGIAGQQITSSEWVNLEDFDGGTFSIFGLIPSTNYAVQVRVSNEEGYSVPSAIHNFSTSSTVDLTKLPGAPIIVETNATESSISVTWRLPEDHTGVVRFAYYRLSEGEDSDPATANEISSSAGSTFNIDLQYPVLARLGTPGIRNPGGTFRLTNANGGTFSVVGLASDTLYKVQMFIVTDAGASPASIIHRQRTKFADPPVVGGIISNLVPNTPENENRPVAPVSLWRTMFYKGVGSIDQLASEREPTIFDALRQGRLITKGGRLFNGVYAPDSRPYRNLLNQLHKIARLLKTSVSYFVNFFDPGAEIFGLDLTEEEIQSVQSFDDVLAFGIRFGHISDDLSKIPWVTVNNVITTRGTVIGGPIGLDRIVFNPSQSDFGRITNRIDTRRLGQTFQMQVRVGSINGWSDPSPVRYLRAYNLYIGGTSRKDQEFAFLSPEIAGKQLQTLTPLEEQEIFTSNSPDAPTMVDFRISRQDETNAIIEVDWEWPDYRGGPLGLFAGPLLPQPPIAGGTFRIVAFHRSDAPEENKRLGISPRYFQSYTQQGNLIDISKRATLRIEGLPFDTQYHIGVSVQNTSGGRSGYQVLPLYVGHPDKVPLEVSVRNMIKDVIYTSPVIGNLYWQLPENAGTIRKVQYQLNEGQWLDVADITAPFITINTQDITNVQMRVENEGGFSPATPNFGIRAPRTVPVIDEVMIEFFRIDIDSATQVRGVAKLARGHSPTGVTLRLFDNEDNSFIEQVAITKWDISGDKLTFTGLFNTDVIEFTKEYRLEARATNYIGQSPIKSVIHDPVVPQITEIQALRETVRQIGGSQRAAISYPNMMPTNFANIINNITEIQFIRTGDDKEQLPPSAGWHRYLPVFNDEGVQQVHEIDIGWDFANRVGNALFKRALNSSGWSKIYRNNVEWVPVIPKDINSGRPQNNPRYVSATSTIDFNFISADFFNTLIDIEYKEADDTDWTRFVTDGFATPNDGYKIEDLTTGVYTIRIRVKVFELFSAWQEFDAVRVP